ncbi:MAG: hypothetical protein U9Q73_02430, partial [Nanoarchaeota archaeon]|nr:hypothetical protein [Nanoarchaeota archaeon]
MRFSRFINLVFFLMLFMCVLSTGIVSAKDPECGGDDECLDSWDCIGNTLLTVTGACVNSYCEYTENYEDCDDYNQDLCDGDYWVHQTGTCNYNQKKCVLENLTGNCNDGQYCNGEETCNVSSGYCIDGDDVVCDDPQVCYSLPGYCDECFDKCVYTFNDTEGPSILDFLVNPIYNGGIFNLTGTVVDECSPIKTAEYFLGRSNQLRDCGVNGTGTVIYPEDGDFNLDKLVEYLKAEDVVFSKDGPNWACMQSQDNAGNWGNCSCVNFETDALPPEEPFDVKLNDEYNSNEYLVCGINPVLTATVCDSESDIQGGEFFFDNEEQVPDWWTGYWMEPGEQFQGIPYGIDFYHCSNISALVNMENISDGTHYIKLRGKDIVENWGKITSQWYFEDQISFIKDTIAPIVEKDIVFNGSSIQCYRNELDESGVFDFEDNMSLIDSCYYVKQGTTVKLTAYDFNPDDNTNGGYNNLSGEYSNNVVIHYVVRWKNESGDDWTILVDTQGGVNQSVIINLNEDSYHLIEYWAVDLCGEASEHRWELDIVDTQVPETTKQIIGPQYYDVNTEKLYIDGVTKINLTCVDPEPHPVNDVTIYYRYRVDEGQGYGSWTELFTYYEAFVFPEESKHELEYYCVDALGNEEEHKFEIDYVDHSKPITNITYGEPFYSDGISKWINSSTSITLTADDGNDIHDSGVNVTYWRNSLVDDDYCRYEYDCQYEEGYGEWNVYTGPFFKPNQSCHLIEYYSVDNVNKTEEVKKQCVYVDNSAPETLKTVSGEKVLMDKNCSSEEEICDYWITQDTEIALDCDDVLPHPVGDVTLFWRWGLDGALGDWNNETDGSMNLTSEEDCLHRLEWYCVDALGNSEGDVNNPIVEMDNVDTQVPNVTRKFVRINNGTIIEGGSEEESVEVAIRSEDTIKLCAEVIDLKQTGDAGVGIFEVEYQFVGLPDPLLQWDEDEQAYCIEMNGSDIRDEGCYLNDCGKWRFEVRAEDFLGNQGEWTNGIEIIVDNVAPMGEVLNPHAGNYYRDGVPFQIYAPAVDFGGDYCSFWGQEQNCPASGVDYCELYAIDYDFEGMNQSEIKECYMDLWTYFVQEVGAEPNIVYLGTVPYEDGVCKGYVSLPEESNLTDTVFLGINYVDKAGNQGVEVFGYHLQLALNPWFSPITMNIDNEGPMVSITNETNLPGPVTSEQNVFIDAKVIESDSGFNGHCWADIYTDNNGTLGENTKLKLNGYGSENICEISDGVPNGLESGNYWAVVKATDKNLNAGNASILMIVDNTLPTMNVVSPAEGGVYGIMFPVSLNVQDSQSPIAGETVMFRVNSESPGWWNVWCIFGTCEDSGWITLIKQENGLYADTINLTKYGITGEKGTYYLGAYVCDNLYESCEDLSCNDGLG